jgi:hypothetical protein
LFEPFSRSFRSLRADGFQLTLGILILVGALLIGWGGWFFLAQVTLYAMTDAAHLEVSENPEAEIKIVAEFEPSDALGRIHASQKARLRLQGFNRAQYGSIPATVDRVADEIRDGKIRVELTVDPDPSFTVPLQDGLPGTLEVEVERISPAALVLRAAGLGNRP